MVFFVVDIGQILAKTALWGQKLAMMKENGTVKVIAMDGVNGILASKLNVCQNKVQQVPDHHNN